MNFSLFNELRTDNLILRKITDNDRTFISEMFTDQDILKYYIIPKEAQQDYKRIVSYWLHDMSKGAGFAWIITKKGNGLFSKDQSCGFFAFEFRDSLQNARISYALKREHRGKGIVTKVTAFIIDILKLQGITSIEADIDKDNISSEKVVIKLGFTTNKSSVLIDPEMMRDGEIRCRHLWRKDLALKLLNQNQTKTGRISLDAPQSELISAINLVTNTIKTKGQVPSLIAKYFYFLGRIKFNERNYDQATEAFSQCNMVIMKNGLAENHETYYWFAKMDELDGKLEDAKMYYGFALENFSGDPDLITMPEIESVLRKLRND